MNTRSLPLPLFVLIVTCSLGRVLSAESDAPPANPLFQEMLTRVIERDQHTGAILLVKAREGSSRHPHALHFSIAREREHDEVVIVLRWNNKINDGIYEKHRLVVDDAIRTELANQDKFQAKLEEIGKTQRKEWDMRFSDLTESRLTVGMTQDEVEKAIGKPSSIEPFAGARAVPVAGSCDNWVYNGFRVTFSDGRAADIFALDEK